MFEGKYIGAMDKNGSSICEGDKVKGVYREKDFKGVVRYHVRSCSFYIEIAQLKCIDFAKLPAVKKLGEFHYKDVEVIYSTHG